MKPRRVYHIHAPMLLYSGISLLVAVGAFHGQNNLLLWAFGLSLGLLAVSGVLSGAMMMNVAVRRDGLRPGRAEPADGEAPDAGPTPLRVRYVVENKSRWLPVFALDITEIIDPPAAQASRATNTAPAPLAGASAEQAGQLADAPYAFVAYVPPRSSVTVESVTRCTARGRISTSAFLVTTTFPFGLIKKSLRYDAPLKTVCRPAGLADLDDTSTLGLGLLAADEADLSSPGSGDEFFALRPYTEGDSPRLIAWRASARTRSLVVRQTAAASPGAVWVVPWLQGAGAADRERVIRLAAAVVERAASRSMRVGLAVPGAAVAGASSLSAAPNRPSATATTEQAGLVSPPRAGPANLSQLLDVLSLLPAQADGATTNPPALRMRRAPGERFIFVHAGDADFTPNLAGSVHLSAATRSAPLAPAPRGAARRTNAVDLAPEPTR